MPPVFKFYFGHQHTSHQQPSLPRAAVSLSAGTSSMAWSQGSIRTPCLGTGTFIHRSWGLVWWWWWWRGVGGQPLNGNAIISPPMAFPPCNTSLIWKRHAYVFMWPPAPCPRANLNQWLKGCSLASLQANYISALLAQRCSREYFAFHISFPPFNVRPVFAVIIWFEPRGSK